MMAGLPGAAPHRRYAFYLDVSGCSGCKACQAACKDRNGLEVGRLFRRVYEVSGGGWQMEGDAWRTDAFAYNLSIACNHCERPICVEVCPTGAMQRRPDGVVWVEAERCVGCRYCAWACPYGAPQYDAAAGVMSKCDFCWDELEQGRPPVCVAACPLRVLNVVGRDEVDGETAADIFPLPDSRLTEPAFCLVPPQAVLDGRAAAGRLANVEETGAAHDDEGPLAWFTVLFQAAVGLQVGLVLAVFVWLPEARQAGARYGWALPPLFVFSLAVFLLAGGALLASFGHLGRPERAWRALANWRSSPLSREVWRASEFFGLALLSITAGVFIERFPPGLLAGWAGFVAVFGLAAVTSMASVYHLRTTPAWAQQKPIRLFLQSTVALGTLGTTALLAILFALPFTISGIWPVYVLLAAACIGTASLGMILIGETRLTRMQVPLAGLHHLPAARQKLWLTRPKAIRRLAFALISAVAGCVALALGSSAWTACAFSLAWLLALFAELQRRAAFYLTRRI